MISRGCFHRRTLIKGSGLARTAGARFAPGIVVQIKLHLSIFLLLLLLLLVLLCFHTSFPASFHTFFH